jgi:hypothetical protein
MAPGAATTRGRTAWLSAGHYRHRTAAALRGFDDCQSETISMQCQTVKTKDGWRNLGDTLDRSCHESRYRSQDRHVGDVRFAIFMLVILAIACGLTFRSEAAPSPSAHPANIDGSRCAKEPGA